MTKTLADDIPKLLRSIAGSENAKANKHDVIFEVAADRIEELEADLDTMTSAYAQIGMLVGRRGTEEHSLIEDIKRDRARSAARIERLLETLKFAATIIGHPDDDGSKLIAEVILER